MHECFLIVKRCEETRVERNSPLVGRRACLKLITICAELLSLLPPVGGAASCLLLLPLLLAGCVRVNRRRRRQQLPPPVPPWWSHHSSKLAGEAEAPYLRLPPFLQPRRRPTVAPVGGRAVNKRPAGRGPARDGWTGLLTPGCPRSTALSRTTTVAHELSFAV